MITISHHSPRYIALAGAYQHKDAIKALADWPDVQWKPEAQAWLVDNRLWDELAQMLGPWLAPASVDFWLGFHTYEPQPVHRRKTKREIMAQKAQDKVAAGKFGAAILAMKEGAK